MTSMFFAQTAPENWSDLLWLPLIATFFGGLMYLLGALKERDGSKAPAKWAGIGICALGAFFGFGPFSTWISSSADSAIYRELYNGRKMMIGHMGGFLIPLFVILVCVGQHFYMRWRNRVFED